MDDIKSISDLVDDCAESAYRRLHTALTTGDLKQMHSTFKEGVQLEPDELRQLLRQHRVEFTDAQFRELILRINTNRDNKCSWDEFVTHLLHEFRDDETYDHDKPLDLPISKPCQFFKSQHRYPIVKLRFSPEMESDRSLNSVRGSYVTCSKDGTLMYWSQDFHMQYTCKSTNPNLQVSKTWVTDFIPLPDVAMVCTASIERDLRFYDTFAGSFLARLIITRLRYEVMCLAYVFAKSEATDSRLICGDADGGVLLFEYNSKARGPFRTNSGTAICQIRWADILANGCNGMRATHFRALHHDIVRQVDYNPELNVIFSAAECRTVAPGRRPPPGLCLTGLGVVRTRTAIRVPKGVTCFAVDAAGQLIVTGGPDCMLRLWSRHATDKPLTVLTGHHDGITFVCLQDAVNRIYSVDHQRIVKVWDSVEQTLLQTYIAVSLALITDRVPYCCTYNDNRRALVFAGVRIISVHCRPLLRLDETDGYTHMGLVSVCLYNALFQSVVTCAHDSMIIVWNVLTGERRQVIRDAHTRKAHGEWFRVEITAGCFDPKQQLLLTGARDGTLKIWTVNAGVCQRNLSIEHMCEVTSVVWLPERILAVGWNKHVTEFADTEVDVFGVQGKQWDTLHADDVSSMSICEPLYLATGSYATELVLWKLQTGQPYRRIDVMRPKLRLQITYTGGKTELGGGPVLNKRSSVTAMPTVYNRTKQLASQLADRQRRLSTVQLPDRTQHAQKIAVHAVLFLRARELHEQRGTLVVALSNGQVQWYTHHPFVAQPYLNEFDAIHMAGDAVTALATDEENHFLVTGTALGYIKTWMVRNFAQPPGEEVHVHMPALRLRFPFMTNDRFLFRAKRQVRLMSNPLLVNSYKAHCQSIVQLVWMDEAQMIISSSVDKSARLWTVGGRYIGTFGSPVKWRTLVQNTPPGTDYPYRTPPDLLRVGSSTTLKVLQGGFVEEPLKVLAAQMRMRARELESLATPGSQMRVYGASTVLNGSKMPFPKLEPWRPNYGLDLTLPSIPIYQHLGYEEAELLVRPKAPELLKLRRSQVRRLPIDDEDDYVDFDIDDHKAVTTNERSN